MKNANRPKVKRKTQIFPLRRLWPSLGVFFIFKFQRFLKSSKRKSLLLRNPVHDMDISVNGGEIFGKILVRFVIHLKGVKSKVAPYTCARTHIRTRARARAHPYTRGAHTRAYTRIRAYTSMPMQIKIGRNAHDKISKN